MSTHSNKKVLKIIVVGKSGVGKSSLMRRYVHTKFTSFRSTIGADFQVKKLSIGNTVITMQIWDTAGQERFQSLGQCYFRGADGALLVYDVTNKDSFVEIEFWRKEVLQQVSKRQESFPFILIGNKIDLLKHPIYKRFNESINCNKMVDLVVHGFSRDIELQLNPKHIPMDILDLMKNFCGSVNAALLYSHKHNIPLYQSSAKDGINVNTIFTEIAKKCLCIGTKSYGYPVTIPLYDNQSTGWIYGCC